MMKKSLFIKYMEEIAIANNGRLISTEWTGYDTRYLFLWKDEREFSIAYRTLKNNGWPLDLDNFLKFSKSFLLSPDMYLKKLQQFAEENKLKLISNKWEGNNHKYLFSSEEIPEIFFSYDYIKNNGYPKDLNKYILKSTSLKKTTDEKLNFIREIAIRNKGKLISEDWMGDKNKHTFAFEDGEVFEITPFYLKAKGWPKDQADHFRRKSNYNKNYDALYKELKTLAEKNNGKIIDKKWKGFEEKYQFKSSQGELFEMYATAIKHYGWPKDINKFLKMRASHNKTSESFLKVMEDMAKLNDYELISEEWKGHKHKYQFKSTTNPSFTASYRYLVECGWPRNIEEYIYISERYNMSDKERLYELSEIALKHGGKLIAKEWSGNKHEYEFQDEHGISFFCNPLNIVNGQWSPDRGLMSEPICRKVLEHLFNNKFIKTRKVLSSEVTGRTKALELDGYCEKLGIAFEYQGYPSHWNPNHDNYEYTKEKDSIKKEACNRLGIILIQIDPFEPNILRKIDSQKILSHILTNLEKAYKELDLTIPVLNKENLIIDTSKIHHGSSMLKQLFKIAEDNNALLLSKKWNGADSKYIFQKEGFVFEISWSYLLQIGWPQDVIAFSKRSKLTNTSPEERMDSLRKIAFENKGKLITTKWLGNNKKHCFQFEDGRLFSVVPKYITEIGWPQDADSYFNRSNSYTNPKKNSDKIKNKESDDRFLVQLQDIANKNEGKLISTEWLGNNEKYIWEFKDGRQFSKSASNMKTAGWPKNADAFFKKSIAHKKTPEERMNELKIIAEKNNGKVLCEDWLGTEKPHLLEFSDGRQFKMSLEKLKTNGWPKNPDKYLKDSLTRAKTLTKGELFFNFKEMIKIELGGELIENKWLGSKIESSILLESGQIILMSPNALKVLKNTNK